MNQSISEGTGGTCGGAQIRGAMHPFSHDLIQGCERFSKLAKESADAVDVRLYNTACLMFAVSAIDAKVNEWIAIEVAVEDAQIPVAFWNELAEIQKSLRLEQKWNLIAGLHNGTLWDRGSEPFQAYEIITALRNELVHFKAQFLGKDEAPSRKIKGLMTHLGLKSDASFIGDDISTWVADLLGFKGLGVWVHGKVRPFYDDVFRLLSGSP